MWARIGVFLVQLVAGIGLGSVLDKVAADKLPAYPSGGVTPFNEGGSFNIKKIAWFLGIAAAAFFLLKFIGKKFNIKLLK